MLRQMVTSQDGFSGSSMHIGDFDEFVAEAEAAEAEVQPKGGEDDDGDDQAGPSKGRAAKIVWLDCDSNKLALAQWQEKHRKTIDELAADLSASRETLSKHLKHQHIEAPLAKAWASKARVIEQALSKVLSNEAEAESLLEAFLENFKKDEAAGGNAGAEADESQEGRRALGCGPPCVKHQLLVTIGSWRELLDSLLEVTTDQQLKQFNKDFPKPKSALVNLQAAAKKTAIQLQRVLAVLAAEGKIVQAKTIAAAKNVEHDQVEDTKTTNLFDLLFEAAGDGDNMVSRIVSLKPTDVSIATVDWFSPWIVTDLEQTAALKGSKLMGTLTFQQSRLMNDAKIDTVKGGCGRGQQKPKGEDVQTEIGEVFSRVLGPLQILTPARLDQLVEDAKAVPDVEQISPEAISWIRTETLPYYLFGMQNSTMHSGCEKNFLPSLRYPISGSRHIVALRISSIERGLRASDVKPVDGGRFVQEQYHNFVNNLSQQQLAVFMRQTPIWVATVGCHDMIYMPHGPFIVQCMFSHLSGSWVQASEGVCCRLHIMSV